jgi:hypothetical protein
MVDQVAWDMQKHGAMCHRTAVRAQQALVAALVTGCYTPPPRLHIIKTMVHPDFQGGCQDPDCIITRDGGSCLGNRLELTVLPPPPQEEVHGHFWTWFDYLTTDIINVVVHHKNDRYVLMNYSHNMSYDPARPPSCLLTDAETEGGLSPIASRLVLSPSCCSHTSRRDTVSLPNARARSPPSYSSPLQGIPSQMQLSPNTGHKSWPAPQHGANVPSRLAWHGQCLLRSSPRYTERRLIYGTGALMSWVTV